MAGGCSEKLTAVLIQQLGAIMQVENATQWWIEGVLFSVTDTPPPMPQWIILCDFGPVCPALSVTVYRDLLVRNILLLAGREVESCFGILPSTRHVVMMTRLNGSNIDGPGLARVLHGQARQARQWRAEIAAADGASMSGPPV